MKFNCGPSAEVRAANKYEARKKKLQEWLEAKCRWHKRFAWVPVRISEDVCVWLESYEVKHITWKMWDDSLFGGLTWRLGDVQRRLLE